MQSLVLQGKEKGTRTWWRYYNSGVINTIKTLRVWIISAKTGTPARVLNTSIDYTKAQPEPGTDMKLAFSYATKNLPRYKNKNYVD